MPGAPPESVTTLETALDIVEALREREEATLTEIAAERELAKSTVHRHLTTLERRGYVVRENDQFRLSLRFLDVGEFTRRRRTAYRLAEATVAELAERTEERVQFVAEENGRAVYVHMKSGSHAVRTNTYVGKHVDIHASAGGLAVLAHLPERRVEQILERRGLPARTPQTITDREVLFDELEAIRERGYSINDQGHIEGLRAVGVPVSGLEGDVLGALSVSGPIHRMDGARFEEELPSLLLGSANELELNIAYE